MAIDEDSFELLERRMAERVEKRVRDRLFTVYGLIGGGVLGAFGWFGIDLMNTFEDEARTTAREAARGVANEVASREVGPVVEDAKAAATAARDAVGEATRETMEARAELRALDAWRQQGQIRLENTLENVDRTSASIEQSLADIRARLEEADKRVQRVRAEGEATFLDADYAEVVQKLAEEVARLDRQLAYLVNEVGLPDTVASDSAEAESDPSTLDEPIEITLNMRTAQRIKESVDTLIAPGEGATIFAQFPFTRTNVAPIIEGLKALGYDIPPWENIAAARGLSELRYFYEADAALAAAAADAINEVLVRNGWRGEVEPKLIESIKIKPKRGILELWLDPIRA